MTTPLLFLDLDGCLNTHDVDPEVLCGHIHTDKVARLNYILRETDARIVLSSAWRYIVYRNEMTLAGMDWLFRSHGILAGRLIGITREDTMVREIYTGDPSTWPMVNERGQQITDWRAENGHAGPYVVIDDLDLGISEAGHPFVWCDGKVGLTDEQAEVCIGLLTKAVVVSAESW